ncbi:uncharacterized protein LOC143851230 [Tasmannia lanceolata]|uniref:uncharacterized protein LOC143851230 n=1 Tax=Tasmannia lanceolata TaxID=3420 RepID=UPI004062EC16
MEFKFRAGDPLASDYISSATTGDDLLPTKAFRGGAYNGSDFPRIENRVIDRETLRREFEKEKIREEIAIREIMLRRELEDEVRREIDLEREIALRNPNHRFLLSESSAGSLFSMGRVGETRSILSNRPGIIPFERLPVEHYSERRLMLRGQLEGRYGDGFSFPIRPSYVDVFKGLPVEPSFEPIASELKPFPEVGGNGQFMFLPKSTMQPDHTLMKRKARIEEESSLFERLDGAEKFQNELFCDLCQVKATSKEDMSKHFQGKKHKAMEGEAGGINTGASAPMPKQADKPTLIKTDAATSEPNMMEKTGDRRKKTRAVWCEHCNIRCFSEVVMASHCQGKKHLAKVQELRESGGAVPANRTAARKMQRVGNTRIMKKWRC